MRILYAEDEEILREIITELLVGEGYDCVSVRNGQEAKDKLTQMDFDLVITDFQMPVMNGAQLLMWCRENHKHMPVIFLTANLERLPIEETVLKDCCTSVLHKPIAFDLLLSAIDEAGRRNHFFECEGKIHSKDSKEGFPGQHYR